MGRPMLLNIEINDEIGDLKCIDKYYSEEHKQKVFIMKCLKCGREKQMVSSTLRAGQGIRHSACGRGLKTKDKIFYNRWQSMRNRTNNKSYTHYSDYGGRGINSNEFENFIDFYDAMYESFIEKSKEMPKNRISLERIDVNGNYCKSNCCWIDIDKQKSNQRKTKRYIVTFPDGHKEYGENVTLFANEHCLDIQSIYDCLNGKYRQHKGFTFINATESQIRRKSI